MHERATGRKLLHQLGHAPRSWVNVRGGTSALIHFVLIIGCIVHESSHLLVWELPEET